MYELEKKPYIHAQKRKKCGKKELKGRTINRRLTAVKACK